jgi:large subunit ribosomal protein L25
MRKFELNVEPRDTGKHFNRKNRVAHKIPAVVYGSTENKNISIDENTLAKYNTRSFENALYNLKSSDSKLNGVAVLLKAVQIHPVTRRPVHADLFALDLTKTVRVSVEIRFEGKPIGFAEGGLLNVVNRQIEIECLPTEIPENVTLDISDLGVGDSKHVSDLSLPKTVKLLSSLDTTLAVVNLFVEEEIAAPVAAAATDAAAGGAAAAAPGAAAPAAGGAAAAPAAGAKAAAAPAAGAKAAAPAKDKK